MSWNTRTSHEASIIFENIRLSYSRIFSEINWILFRSLNEAYTSSTPNTDGGCHAFSSPFAPVVSSSSFTLGACGNLSCCGADRLAGRAWKHGRSPCHQRAALRAVWHPRPDKVAWWQPETQSAPIRDSEAAGAQPAAFAVSGAWADHFHYKETNLGCSTVSLCDILAPQHAERIRSSP